MSRSSLKAAARTAASLLFLLASGFAPGELSATPAQVSFNFERPGLSVPKFTLTVEETGTARYEADEIFAAKSSEESEPQSAQHVSRTVTLSKAATDRIFSNARALDRFHALCASKAKNIADTGAKTFHYTGEGGDGSCTFNYSENKRVVLLTDLFLSIARTLDTGRKLDFQHRFDRLGLDATMASFAEEVNSGRATEIGIIAPTLHSLADDSEVLQRVRQRAARLLQLAQLPS